MAGARALKLRLHCPTALPKLFNSSSSECVRYDDCMETEMSSTCSKVVRKKYQQFTRRVLM